MSSKRYRYTGIDQQGTRINGEVTAVNYAAAKIALNDKKITLLKMRPEIVFLNRRIQPKILNDFIRQLASLINSQIPVITTFNIIAKSSQHHGLKALVKQLSEDISTGTTITEAFKKHSRYFDSLFCNLLYVGEQSGTLDKVLNYIADYKEKSANLHRKIKKALFYPICILLVALTVTALLLVFVVPQFAKLFQGFGAVLPAYTRTIIATADFLKNNGIIFSVTIILIIFLLRWLIKKSAKIATLVDSLAIKTPLIGKNLKKAILARFSLILAITYKAGLPLVEALQIAAYVVGNRVYRQALLTAKIELSHGQTLAAVITANNRLFPARVGQMIAIGEEGGTLDTMLLKISEYYEAEVSYLIDNLNNLLEPAIMVILGIVIGGLIIGMYLPIFRLGTVI